MKTWSPKKDEVPRNWLIIDAKDRILGRAAAEAARLLGGKHKPHFTPHADAGDFVVVINCDKVKLTGNKLKQKTYYRHSNYPGGLKSTKAEKLLKEKPDRMFWLAVRGMLPKNSLGRAQLRKLKVYAGDTHPHEAQQPEVHTF